MSRYLPASFLVVSVLLLWQALRLPQQDQFGPGPGLFPSFVASLVTAVCALLWLFPGLMRSPSASAATDEGPLDAQQRRAFMGCAAGVLLMLASIYTGFLVGALLIALAVAWYGESRSLRSAVVFGICAGLVSVAGLGGLMGVDLPQIELDRMLMRLVRPA